MPTFEMLPIDQIELDLKNPRIAKWLEIYLDSPNDAQIALALQYGSREEDDKSVSYQSLKESIKTNKGIIHPIIVNKQNNNKFIVIEGNTRTHIYRELHNNDPEDLWGKIPAMVYQQLPQQSIDAIRLQAHLVGTRAWDPYSKAKYLNMLQSVEYLSFNQIVDFCGGKKREVQNLISAYNDMEKYYRPILESDQDFDHTRFSAFVELQKSSIIEAIMSANFSKTDFAKWVHSGKFYPNLQTIRKLPQILQNEKAKTVFLQSGAEEAQKLIIIPNPETSLAAATLEQLSRELNKRINEIPYETLQQMRERRKKDELTEIHDALDSLQELCNDLENESE